jgi:phosphoribosylanthranilate isomerase
VRVVTDAGVDALGLIFSPLSRRVVDVGAAVEIAAEIPAFTTTVGVFVNDSTREIDKVLEKVPIACLQFHGDELAEDCEKFGIPYIKTVRMRDGASYTEVARAHPKAKAILLDSYHPEKYGGTGESFSWERAREDCGKPLILAGGLNAENVAEAIIVSGAYGVDISSGVESAPGIKNPRKIRDLVAVIRECNQAVLVTDLQGRVAS